MNGAILMLATDGRGVDERWVNLVRAATTGPYAGKVTVLAHADHVAALQGGKARVEVAQAPAGGTLGRVWALFRTIRALAPDEGFGIVGAHNEVEHYAALLYRAFAGRPVVVMKTKLDGVPLPLTRWNRFIHCKQTGINLFWTQELELRNRGGRQPHELFIDRPMVLLQPALGEDSPAQMLHHAFDSLFAPTRDSPVGAKKDYSGIGLTYITHFYLNQKSTAAVFEMVAKYASYPADVLDRVHFVIVDDGSPLPYEVPQLPLNLTWIKVRQDIRWNNPGARNLGVTYAKSDKILITDVDHEFPPETLRHMAERGSPGKRIYKLWRRDPASGKLEHGHPNIFFMSRARFMENFGYDEEFCGAYASDDFRFVKLQKARGSAMPHLPKRFWCSDRPKIDRAKGYHSLVRDHSFNTPVDRRKDIELAWYGHDAGASRMFLNFEWDIVSQQKRPGQPVWPVDRWWKRLWFVRAILPRW